MIYIKLIEKCMKQWYWALGERERNAHAPQYSDHCFTGDYPTELEDRDSDRASKDFQLSLLAEVS